MAERRRQSCGRHPLQGGQGPDGRNDLRLPPAPRQVRGGPGGAGLLRRGPDEGQKGGLILIKNIYIFYGWVCFN